MREKEEDKEANYFWLDNCFEKPLDVTLTTTVHRPEMITGSPHNFGKQTEILLSEFSLWIWDRAELKTTQLILLLADFIVIYYWIMIFSHVWRRFSVKHFCKYCCVRIRQPTNQMVDQKTNGILPHNCCPTGQIGYRNSSRVFQGIFTIT